mgnify:FL=1
MECEFCGKTLPIVFASREGDAFTAMDRVKELCPDGHFVYDADDHIVYEYFSTNVVPCIDGYRHLCLDCANKLSTYSEKLLNKHDSMRETFVRNTALNTIRKHRTDQATAYLVAFDLDVEEHPVAQVFKKTDGVYRLCNRLNDGTVGTVLKYMEE